MGLRPVYDKFLVEVDSEWKKEIQGKNGVIGVAFGTDDGNDLDRSIGAQRRGKVLALPRAVSDHFFVTGIQEQVQVGDELLFHFNSILEASRVDIDVNDKYYYLVHMQNVFAIIRNGEYIMYGGRILAEPLFDDSVLEDGMRVKKKGTIITEINVSHNLKRARLAHIGLPRDYEQPTDAQSGEIIYYEKDSDFENEIDGKVYFCMVQDDIVMVE